MSLQARPAKLLSLSLASAAALYAFGAPAAQAAQTATLNYKCKFPVIGTQPLALEISLDFPDTWPEGVPTNAFGITAKASAGGTTSQGLGLIEGLSTISGVRESELPGKGTAARAKIIGANGSVTNVRVPIDVDPYTVSPPIPSPLVLLAHGSTPSLALDGIGQFRVELTELILNLKGLDASGAPVEGLITPTKDLSTPPVAYADLDGDPGTFNVPCILDPAFPNQNVQLASLLVSPPCDCGEPPTVPGADNLPYVVSDFTPHSINLRWGPSTDVGSGLKEYIIDYEGAPAGGVKVPAGTTNKLITGLGADSEYIFSVRAVDNSGNSSEASEQTLFTPPEPVGPLGPGVPSATPTETSFALTWPAATGNVVSYNVYSGATKVTSSTTNSVTLTGITPGTTYAISVEAVYGDGTVSARSGVANLKTLDDTTAPTNPVVTGTTLNDSATLSWSGASDNVGIAGYDVFVGTATAPKASVTGTTATIAGLSPDTLYSFKVIARDAAGNRSIGAVIALRTLPLPIPIPLSRTTYDLKGSTQIKTLSKGTLPVTGTLGADFVGATGGISADLTLADTSGKLTALGFLPVTAKIGFAPSGKTTGTLIEGVLKTNSKVRIKVKEVKLFGAIPLASGNSCQTKSLSDINLRSTQAQFARLTGGPIAGTYTISDLNGCGVLNGLVSPLTAGAGNTIALNLTPRP